MPALRLVASLLLASACVAASDSGPTHDYVLTPKSNNDPNTRLNQKDLGETPALGFPPPPPLPPGAPEWPKAPFDVTYWPVNYSDPDFVIPNATTLCNASEIPNSNRTAASMCMDKETPFPIEGTECFFECNPGYIALGRHVCQWHDLDFIADNSKNGDPKHLANAWMEQNKPENGGHKYSFHGGRCQKLCKADEEGFEQTCPGSAPGTGHTRRYAKSTLTSKITDAHAMSPHATYQAAGAEESDGPADCMLTECFPNKRDNLWNTAKGVYDVMQIARDRMTGVYYNEVNVDWFVRYMEKTHGTDYKVDNGSPVDQCGGTSAGDWFHEALGVYQKEMDKSGGLGLNRGGGGKNYSIDATAMGIMTEVVGSALAFQSPTQAVEKIIGTISNLTHGSAHEVVNYPGNHSVKSEGHFTFYRDSRGFFEHFYGHREMDRTNPVATAMLVQAGLFARSYFSAVAAGERSHIGGLERWGDLGLEALDDAGKASFGAAVSELSTVVEELYDSIDFTHIGCDDKTGKLTPGGTGIPFTISREEDQCGGPASTYPDKDGLYNYTEAHNYVYLAYQQACGAQLPGECNNTDIELMWNRWQARRLHTNHHYSDVPLLTTFGGYILQLVYYTNNNFNNDTRYQELFYNNWWADQTYYKQGLYAGKRGRYGLGEGPESKWCNEQKSYHSAALNEKAKALTPGVRQGMIVGGASHCSSISANAVAGYLPVNQPEVEKHLLLLLEDGETVVPLPCTDHAVLWRESLQEPMRGITSGDGREGRITPLDLSPSLLGLATLFLPDKTFYKKYSKHFSHDGEDAGPISMPELRAQRLRREASKAQLAEGEEILLKCNALCAGDGPVLTQLYDASGTPEQCTVDCAAAYGELYAVGRVRQAGAGAKSDTKLEQKGASIPHRTTQSSAIEKAQLAEGEEILLKCNALCARDGPVLSELYDASGTPAQCTIDCAAAYGEFFSGVGMQNLTGTAREASRFVQTANHTTDTSRVLLKCYAECGASRNDASTCTMDCALRHLHVAGSGSESTASGAKHVVRRNSELIHMHLAVDLRASWSSNIPKLRLRARSGKAVAVSTAKRAGSTAKMAALLAK